MRVITLAAVALLASAGESVVAMSLFNSASCNKGMLWPYVRNPGDCLTDAEIAAGARGVYNGPTDTNPDIGAIAAPAPQAPVTEGGQTVSVPAVDQTGAPVMVQTPAGGVPVQAQMPQTQTVTEFSCTKGLLWPFRRKMGDCLTTAEKRRGMTGVFGGGTGMITREVPVQQVTYQQPAPVQAVPQAVYQQVAPVQPGQQVIYQQVAPAQPGQQVIYQQVPQAQPGQQVIYQQVAPAQPAPQVVYQPAPAAQPGDQVIYQQVPAQPAAEQPTQQVIYQQPAPPAVYQPGPAGTAVVDTSTGQVVMVAPAPAPRQAGAPAGCTKGTLWPFIKKPGDCESHSIQRKR